MYSTKRTITRFILPIAFTFLMSFSNKTPKVFVVGDSISIQYGPYLKNALTGFFEYDRKRGEGQAVTDLDNPVGANGGDSSRVLEYLTELSKNTDFRTDYLLINCGLHDIKTDPKTQKPQVDLSDYRKNLEQIVKLSQKMKAKMVWVNSTPVIDSVHNKRASFHRYAKDLNTYNSAAKAIMDENGIPIIDLFTFTEKFGRAAYIDHVHFTNEVREKQGDFIAGFLSKYVH